VDIYSSFDIAIDDWNTKLQKLAAKPEMELKPRIDLSKLNSNILKRTREVNEILHNLVPENFGFNAEVKDLAKNLESNKTEELMKVYDQLYPPKKSSPGNKRLDDRVDKSRSPYHDERPREKYPRNSDYSNIRSSVRIVSRNIDLVG